MKQIAVRSLRGNYWCMKLTSVAMNCIEVPKTCFLVAVELLIEDRLRRVWRSYRRLEDQGANVDLMESMFYLAFCRNVRKVMFTIYDSLYQMSFLSPCMESMIVWLSSILLFIIYSISCLCFSSFSNMFWMKTLLWFN